MSIQVVILAAGLGKRMYSNHPKVLHTLAGKALLEHVIDTALQLSPKKKPVVVIGHQSSLLQEKMAHKDVNWVEQKDQWGTGHAVLQALPEINDEDHVLILYGDVPLTSLHTLKNLIDNTPMNAVGMLTAVLANPHGYGRIIRDKQQQIVAIVEEKDASAEQRKIAEINPGIYYAPAKYLKSWLPGLKNHNAQNEYYLTDIIPLAVNEKISIFSVQPLLNEEILGVNDRLQLAHLERFYQRNLTDVLLRQGVTIIDPARIDIRGDVQIGRDVTLDVNVILEGRVIIGDDCVIGPHTILRNCELGNGVEIKANSMVDGATIGNDAKIGPFARLRPGAVLADQVQIGNFVEIKQSHIGQGSKASHLSYIGDTEIGKNVNIGAGTITCNYDGINKHKTIIGDDVFIGSCTQLIAPVTIGAGATIGAGSTITHDAPAHKLTIARSVQRTIEEWQRPVKKK